MKVLHIVLTLNVGGLERFVLDLCNNYPIEVQPRILCLEEIGALGGIKLNYKCSSANKKKGIDFSVVKKICAIVKENNIDIIHTHNQGPNFYGSIAGFMSRIPVIHTKHGQNDPRNKKRIILDKISSFFTDKIVCVSDDAKRICYEQIGIPKRKLDVILNGVDSRRYKPLQKKRKLFDSEKIIIGNVARLAVEKDQFTLLRAAKIVLETYRNIQFVLVGDGDQRSKLEALANSIGIQQWVTFLGMRNDIEEIVPEMDVFVLSSTTEGVSLTLLEAMSCGIPIIATNVGGNAEVVIDKANGFITPARDERAIAEKMIKLIDDPGLRLRMGKAGRERVLEHFSIRSAAQKYFDHYRKLASY